MATQVPPYNVIIEQLVDNHIDIIQDIPQLDDFKKYIVMELLSESSSDSSDESDDSEMVFRALEIVLCKKQKRRRRGNFIESTVRNFSSNDFRHHFRLSRATFEKLCGRLASAGVLPAQHFTERPEQNAEKNLLISLWYFSNQEAIKSIASRFDVCCSTVKTIVRRVTQWLLLLKHTYVRWPVGPRKAHVVDQFQKKKGFPNVIGAIDCTHVSIPAPSEHREQYEHQGRHSIVLQGVCDGDFRFTDVYCGEPGILDEASVLLKSPLFALTGTNREMFADEAYLVGSDAYPFLPWLVPPFKETTILTQKQKNFNESLLATKVCIEMAFKLLKGRFRRLLYVDMPSVAEISDVVTACCVLHNVCLEEKNDELLPVENCSMDLSVPSDVGVVKDRRLELLNLIGSQIRHD